MWDGRGGLYGGHIMDLPRVLVKGLPEKLTIAHVAFGAPTAASDPWGLLVMV